MIWASYILLSIGVGSFSFIIATGLAFMMRDHWTGDVMRKLMWHLFKWPSVILYHGEYPGTVDACRLVRHSRVRGRYATYLSFGIATIFLREGYRAEGKIYFTRWKPAPWCFGWNMWPIVEP